MKYYCSETESNFIFCVEDADPVYEDNLLHAWFRKSDEKYLKKYNKDMESSGVSSEDKEIISANFSRLGPSMFKGIFDWEKVLTSIAAALYENDIEWYILGSASEAAFGVNIKPHDIDIIIHTKDFFKVKDLFRDYVIEPFVDNKGTWVVRYFGRLCMDGAIVDIAADDEKNADKHSYTKIQWNGFDLHIEPLQSRYQIEIQRNRTERIRAIEDYMENK